MKKILNLVLHYVEIMRIRADGIFLLNFHGYRRKKIVGRYFIIIVYLFFFHIAYNGYVIYWTSVKPIILDFVIEQKNFLFKPLSKIMKCLDMVGTSVVKSLKPSLIIFFTILSNRKRVKIVYIIENTWDESADFSYRVY